MNRRLYGDGALHAARHAEGFLRRHGDSLSEVLQVTSGDRGLDLFCDAARLLDFLSPDPAEVGKVFRGMRDLLAEAETPGNPYIVSLRWHGARLSEITAGLPK